MRQATTNERSPASDRGPFAVGIGGPGGPRRELLPRIWPWLASAWLVFAVVNPMVALLRADPTPTEIVGLVSWTVAFVAIYLSLTLRHPFRGAALAPSELPLRAGLLAALAALVLSFNLVYDHDWRWLYLYVVIAAAVTLPTRGAAWTLAATVVLAVIETASAGWTEFPGVDSVTSADWSQLGGLAVIGLSMIAVGRLVVAVGELRAAQDQIAVLAAAEAVAEERLRFARDLHDLLGHSLSLITLKSELAGRLARTDGERAAAEIADVERVARQALREVREAVAGYRRPTLATELAGVRDLLAAAGIETRIEATAGPLPPAVDAALAWAVREGATNVIRHSRARSCAIHVTRQDGTVCAEVSDDGRGAPASAPAKTAGSGLSGLAERVADLDGRITAETREGGGFRLHVALPIPDGARPVPVPGGAQARGA